MLPPRVQLFRNRTGGASLDSRRCVGGRRLVAPLQHAALQFRPRAEKDHFHDSEAPDDPLKSTCLITIPDPAAVFRGS
jgi:hypothetical protein